MLSLADVRSAVESCPHELQSVVDKDWSWANVCPVAAFGADCLTDQAGVVDDMLLNPINLGNVLDYGADPSGEKQTVQVLLNSNLRHV